MSEEHCRRCIEMHRRAQRNEGAAERLEGLRIRMQREITYQLARALVNERHWASLLRVERERLTRIPRWIRRLFGAA